MMSWMIFVWIAVGAVIGATLLAALIIYAMAASGPWFKLK